jgi:hypothetical protein
MAMNVPHPTPYRKWIRRDSVCWQSATYSKYLLVCTQDSVSLSSYTGCAECSAHCWKQFLLKKIIITRSGPKNGQICYKKTDSEKCENNIKLKPSTSGTEESKISENRCTLVINYSSLF